MSARPETLVIIVTFNGQEYIEGCLRCLEPSRGLVDVLCIDNKSSDQTVQLIEENFPWVECIKSARNLGFGKANNRGFQYARKKGYQYVLLLNQDVEVEAQAINHLLRHKSSCSDFILSPAQLDGSGKEWDYRFRTYISPEIIAAYDINDPFSEPRKIRFANAAAWLLSIETLTKIGFFDPIFPHYGEDTDYANRAAFHNIGFLLIPEAQIRHLRTRPNTVRPAKKGKTLLLGSMAIAKNINHGFFGQFLKGLKLIVKEFVKSIFRNPSFLYATICLKNLIQFIIVQPKILQHRSISKQQKPFIVE